MRYKQAKKSIPGEWEETLPIKKNISVYIVVSDVKPMMHDIHNMNETDFIALWFDMFWREKIIHLSLDFSKYVFMVRYFSLHSIQTSPQPVLS